MLRFRLMVAFLLIFALVPLFAQRKITVKMASPVPENSPWGQYLNQMALDWKRITNGEVEVIIYHNGIAGTETAVMRNLRVNQIQAAVLSTLGLQEISPEVMTLSCPFLIRDNDELDLVLGDLKKQLEEKIDSRGFTTIAWAQVGWVKFFSKSPILTPADLKRQKLGIDGEQTELNQAFKTMGFQMIPVTRGEILIALNSNMVDAVFQSPIAVGSTQVFGLAKNMADINIAPFMGAIIVNQRTWRVIPDRYKPLLIESARKGEAELNRSSRQMESEMIKTMGNYGLTVNQLSPEHEQLWYDEIGRAMPSLLGSVFDEGVYRRIETLLRNHRSGRP